MDPNAEETAKEAWITACAAYEAAKQAKIAAENAYTAILSYGVTR